MTHTPECQLYATVLDLQIAKGIPLESSEDQTRFTDALDRASRLIEDHCGRIFNKSEPATTETFTALDPWTVLLTRDLSAQSGVTVDVDRDGDLTCEETLAAGTYYFEEWGGRVAGNARPLVALRINPRAGGTPLPLHRRAVQITGTWGWPSIPLPIEAACLRIAERLLELPNAPLGIAQAGATVANTGGGTRLIVPRDQDVLDALAPFVRRVGRFA